jgi:hypothetical protein
MIHIVLLSMVLSIGPNSTEVRSCDSVVAEAHDLIVDGDFEGASDALSYYTDGPTRDLLTAVESCDATSAQL